MANNLLRKPFLQRLTLQHFRERLAHLDALPQLALLGLISGIATGGVMVIFIISLNLITELLLGIEPENHEALPLINRILAPVIGCLVLAVIFRLSKSRWRASGVGHVIERFTFNQGHMPWPNAIGQFFNAIISLGSGLSAGREGPAVHMGASISSLMGVHLKLPNNSIRLLVGCGSAAAIGASFNTPIAGVIFAMEVIMAEYTLVGFTPIILASVTGTALSQWLLGGESLFNATPQALYTLAELPWVSASGIIVGVFAALFISYSGLLFRTHHWAVEIRFLLAGLLTALFAALLPSLLGSGFDLVNLSFSGDLGLGLLVFLAISKLLLTATTFGLGVPIGIIGPIMVAGGLLGAATGHIGGYLAGTQVSDISIYAMIGMASMMAACLQAPLAALMALMELTANPHIIMPGMLAVVSATLTSRYLLPDHPSIFQYALELKGLKLHDPALSQILSRTGISAVMSRDFKRCTNSMNPGLAKTILAAKPRWLLIHEEDNNHFVLLPTADLANHLYLLSQNGKKEPDQIILNEVPSEDRISASPLPQTATLAEAQTRIADMRTDALYITGANGAVIGIVTPEMIESFYR